MHNKISKFIENIIEDAPLGALKNETQLASYVSDKMISAGLDFNLIDEWIENYFILIEKANTEKQSGTDQDTPPDTSKTKITIRKKHPSVDIPYDLTPYDGTGNFTPTSGDQILDPQDFESEEDEAELLSDEEESLDEQILNEANMSGKATGYPGKTGTFEKYVVDNPKVDDVTFETSKETILYNPKTHEKERDVAKGFTFKMISKTIKDLVVIDKVFSAKIKAGSDFHYVKLTAILKPTGKHVEFPEVTLKGKRNKSVYVPFKPGHRHEAQTVNLFINGSSAIWEFEHEGQPYKILRLSAPMAKVKGQPKTDVFVKLDKPVKGVGTDLKISLKDINADFLENWIIPDRFIQIFGKSTGQKIINDTHKALSQDKINTNAKGIAFFITGTRPKNTVYDIKSKDQIIEILAGKKKFKAFPEAVANSFYKGSIPKQITTFLSNLLPIDAVSTSPSLIARGTNESRSASICFTRDSTGLWTLTPQWQKYFKIK